MTIVVRSSGVDAKGMETAPGVGTQGAMPVPRPFSTKLNWGWQAPRSAWGWEMPWTDDAPTILDVMKAPTATLIPAGNEADLLMVHSLPQTGLNEFKRLFIDLKDPEPQTVTQIVPRRGWIGDSNHDLDVHANPIVQHRTGRPRPTAATCSFPLTPSVFAL